jgi:hypothetical protein
LNPFFAEEIVRELAERGVTIVLSVVLSVRDTVGGLIVMLNQCRGG